MIKINLKHMHITKNKYIIVAYKREEYEETLFNITAATKVVRAATR